jgi:hypothetical protein
MLTRAAGMAAKRRTGKCLLVLFLRSHKIILEIGENTTRIKPNGAALEM